MDQAQPPYRFGLQPAQPWLDHLQSEGYVVLANVASASDVQRARELIWKDIENMWSVSRTDPSTWNGFGVGLPGLCPNLAQAAGPWHLRGLQSVRHAFGCIWGSAEKPEEELLTSMDCVLLWRPWWKNAEWTPVTEGLHLDQNPFTKPDLECVQGMMPLIEVSEASGGLQVVPQSHRSENKSELQERYKHWEMRGDWCLLFDNDALSLTSDYDASVWHTEGRVHDVGRERDDDAAHARPAISPWREMVSTSMHLLDELHMHHRTPTR
eukprot:TRINITY_DN7488_c0_g1_i3.p1 TRINITY_DN7488_c0_g1~~TRINITY_DN7488_c0_g1_i3.p1  ORF type:complete len:267 (-),score=28.64 TRINITY_DN7488_c0_g1_i3:127-927(-)